MLPRLKGVRRALVLLAGLAARVLGQAPQVDSAVPWAKLLTVPQPRQATAWAGFRYPSVLASASIPGEVQLELLVGADGKPIWNESRVVRSTHDLFTNSVRAAVTKWEFTTPTFEDQPVTTIVPVTVTFLLPEDHDVPVHEVPAEAIIDSGGIRVRSGWEPVPRELTVPRDTADVKWAKLIVLLQLLSMNPNADTLATTCVRWSDKPNHALPPAMIRRIRAQYSAVVNADACPRTYFSIAPSVNSLGRPVRTMPRGHVNPVWVAVGGVQPWTADLYVMQGYVAPAGGSHKYRCEAERDERGRWLATCELRSSTMY